MLNLIHFASSFSFTFYSLFNTELSHALQKYSVLNIPYNQSVDNTRLQL